MNSEDRYDSLFQYYGDQYDIDWLLLKAQVKAESDFNPDAISRASAKGLAQFMDPTFAEWFDGTPGIQQKETSSRKLIDVRDPEDAIKAQAAFMSFLLKKYKGDLPKALAAYNWGMGNLKKWMKAAGKKLPEETENYIKSTIEFYKHYQKEVVV